MFRFVLSFIFLFFASQSFTQSGTLDSSKTGIYYFKTVEKVTVKGYFKNTKRHKIWTWYNVDGSIHKQIKYKQGQQLWLIYFEKNKPWLKINRHGKKKVIRACKCQEPSY
ncbi:MAG: hypothetical protein ACKVQB_12620 [Bacteroidia bacterium]